MLLAGALTYAGHLLDAEAQFREAALLSQAAQDTALHVRALSGLGVTLHRQGHYEQALATFLQAQQRLDPADLFGRFRLLSNIGTAYVELGEHDLALQSHLEALELAEQHGEEAYVLLAVVNIVIDYGQLGQVQRVLDLSAHHLPQLRALGLRQHELVLLTHTLSALVRDQRLEHLPPTMTAIRQLLNDRGALVQEDVVLALLTLGRAALLRGELEGALSLSGEGLHLAEASGLAARTSALHRLHSDVLRAQGQWEGAYLALLEHHQREERRREEVMSRRLKVEAHRLHIRLLEERARVERTRQEQLQAQQDEMETLAYRDELTGLLNRPAFRRAAERAVLQWQAGLPDSGELALLFVDLDGFKPLNDVYGHAFGDLVLRAAGQRLQEGLRPEELAARLGGDEFVLLIFRENAAAVQRVRDTVWAALNTQMVLGEHMVQLGASVGLAVAEEGEGLSHLMQRADAAMYAQKRQR